ncbi:MAG: hypothetical protein M1822_005766 [Bathelium mastoideum]|nr:MAG: hypothetical protein M1822_005766 [Bathelium mastoideum]
MAVRRLFITGATGYIGGAVLDTLHKLHPELEVTALLRTPTTSFSDKHPKVKVVKGSFDDFAIIEAAANDADIVIHTGDIDHPGCARAILSGLTSKTTPCYLIHLTGTGCISDEREQTWRGDYNPHIWNDITEIDDIYNLPDSAQHHVIDKWIQDASKGQLKTVTICPPDIYGQSCSTGSRNTFLVPNYVEALMQHKEAFYLGKGENIRAVTHIDDVVALFMLLLEGALQGGGDVHWGKEGFYFAVSDGVPWKKAAEEIAGIGCEQGWLPKETPVVSWDKDRLASLLPEDPGRVLYLWGSNSRAESARAKALGWKPKAPTFWEALREDCKIAVERAQVK